MQRKVDKLNTWRTWIVVTGLVLAPHAISADKPLVDECRLAPSFQQPSAALTQEELRTALASTSSARAGQRRVQVGPRDTLWSIARTNRPSRDITIKQAMLAIQDANPRAFPSGNINEMEAGSTLVIPNAAAMRGRSAQQAEIEVRRQNQAWVAARAPHHPSQGAPRTQAEPQPTPAERQQPERLDSRPPVQPARDLQLTAPSADDEQQALIGELETRLEQSEDALYRVEREKDELATRLSEMQGQLDTLQQLLRLKDEQLDELEAQLAAAPQGQARPAAPTPAPPVHQPQVTTEPSLEDLLRQPLALGVLAGLLLLLVFLLLAWLSARNKLAKNLLEQAESDEARRREAELHSLTDSNARSDDFDRDLNAQPLHDLEDLEGMDDLELDDDLSDELQDLDLDSDTPEAPEQAQPAAKVARDPLQEAEMFIAYGRLEQAAGFLQKAIAEQPEREDLRVKLLEVLVELNDEDTFEQQRQQLEAQSPSAASRTRAAELAEMLAKSAAAGAATAGAAAAVAASEEAQAEDLGELELPDDELSDLELDDIFGSDEEADTPAEADEGFGDLGDLDQLEADLDQVLNEKEPLEPTPEEDLDDPLADLEELNENEAEDLDLELDLEKPLDAAELTGDSVDLQDFEPVDYQSEAEDVLSALDELGLDTEEDSAAGDDAEEPLRSPEVDEELSAFSEDFPGLTELDSSDVDSSTDDLADLDELDLGRLGKDEGDLSAFEDLDQLDLDGDLDFSANDGDMNTQLDLATAYIEMGDKEGAREILERVVAEGDADQKATAQQMLEALNA